jgi:hypothetical protein
MAEVATAAEAAAATVEAAASAVAAMVAVASVEAAMEVADLVEAAVRATEAAATEAEPIAGRPMGRTRALAGMLLVATAAMDARVRRAARQRPHRALALEPGIRRHRVQCRAVPALLRANGIRSAQRHLAETEQ